MTEGLSFEVHTFVADSVLYKESVRSLLKLTLIAASHPENFEGQTESKIMVAGLECLKNLGVSVELIEEVVAEEGW